MGKQPSPPWKFKGSLTDLCERNNHSNYLNNNVSLVQSVAHISLQEKKMIKTGIRETLQSSLCLALLPSIIY